MVAGSVSSTSNASSSRSRPCSEMDNTSDSHKSKGGSGIGKQKSKKDVKVAMELPSKRRFLDTKTISNLTIQNPSNSTETPRMKLARTVTHEVIPTCFAAIPGQEQDDATSKTPDLLRPLDVHSPTSVRDDGDGSMSPTHDSRINRVRPLAQHMTFLHREHTIQVPLKPVLARLIAHNCNRHSLFSTPVDPVALNLLDYTRVITRPMDLGTIKSKLHAGVYTSKEAFAADVRLVFSNACTYNPPNHPVHTAAKTLLNYFEEEMGKLAAGTKVKHSCLICMGHTCHICQSGCLHLEPPPVLCVAQGVGIGNRRPLNCGAKVRKGAVYYTSRDGSKSWCHRCYMNLPSVLSFDHDCALSGDEVRPTRPDYVQRVIRKRDLLPRKNAMEIIESWVECKRCHRYMHAHCALLGCPCSLSNKTKIKPTTHVPSYVCGQLHPQFVESSDDLPNQISLPSNACTAFIQKALHTLLANESLCAQTLAVRLLSNTIEECSLPKHIRHYFPGTPAEDTYRSMCIGLFQTIDGMPVLLFTMYVQLYSSSKTAYIAYLDSVDHFQPRSLRSEVYREMVSSFLAYLASERYKQVHIWACPPTRGNSYIFWNHPATQKTPTRDRLCSWYCDILARCAARGVVADVSSLYDFAVIQGHPLPLLEGDYWIDEALRVYKASLQRHARTTACLSQHSNISRVEARINDVLQTSVARPFALPVNPVAVPDYYCVVQKPIDLGCIHSKLVLGAYDTLKDLKEDLMLLNENAHHFNGSQHIVAKMAKELVEEKLVFDEVDALDLRLPRQVDVHEKVESRSNCIDITHADSIKVRMLGKDDLHTVSDQRRYKLNSNKEIKHKGTSSSGGILNKPECNDWLFSEVTESLRKMKRDFFVVTLNTDYSDPKACHYHEDSSQDKEEKKGFCEDNMCESRNVFLENCQKNHWQFDTLRHAKYSTVKILRHLLNRETSLKNKEYFCSICSHPILDIAWKSNKACTKIVSGAIRTRQLYSNAEICGNCWKALRTVKEQNDYVPCAISKES